MNRGGSWNNNARNCRAANRNRNTPENRNNNLGLRLASTKEEGPEPVRPKNVPGAPLLFRRLSCSGTVSPTKSNRAPGAGSGSKHPAKAPEVWRNCAQLIPSRSSTVCVSLFRLGVSCVKPVSSYSETRVVGFSCVMFVKRSARRDSVKDAATRLGIKEYLMKPVSKADLAYAVRNAFDAS